MGKKRKELTDNQIIEQLTEYRDMGFDTFQLRELELGMRAGIDERKYADKKYIFFQMAELRKGLVSGVDISLYSDVFFDWFQMREIRKGLEQGLDVSLYRDVDMDYLLMREIRKGLEYNINITPYVKRGYSRSILRIIRAAKSDNIDLDRYLQEGYDSKQLNEIRKGIKYNLNIREYSNLMMSGDQMREIRYGLKDGIDISAYNDIKYNWMQMQELRLGITKGLETYWYDNPYFSARQMREIRLGLEENLDVFTYATQMWSATDMQRKREELMAARDSRAEEKQVVEILETVPDMDGDDRKSEVTEQERGTNRDIYIEISSDEMTADIVFPKATGYFLVTKAKIDKLIEDNGIKQGIREEVIHRLVTGYIPESGRVTIAQGTPCVNGKDGYYYFMFKTELPTIPKIKGDGSVDYKNVDLFEPVEAGQKLAVFYPATSGSYGFTVKGKLITPAKGKNPPRLTGTGFSLLEDEVTYVSNLSGSISYYNYTIKISSLYHVKGDVTAYSGNIKFKGDVHISGSVGGGVTIEADGNVIIDGYVEAAIIRAGNDVLIRSGVSGRDEGIIKAGRNIYGKFFENIMLMADNTIESNYILNCECVAMNMVNVSGEKGAIVGGTTYAINGVSASVVGNQAEIRTVFEIGANKYYLAKVRDYDAEIEELGKKAIVLKEEMDKLIAKTEPEALKTLTIFKNIQSSLISKLHELEQIKKERAEYVRTKEKKLTEIGLKVTHYAYTGCVIRVDDKQLLLADTVYEVFFRKQNNKVAMLSFDD